jgi:DNA (cytosine-5)-methyltransferase 1
VNGLTATDQFCGAGGSSLGAAIAGVELRLGLNHSQLAIDTHNTNFPDADHDCTDISACDPRRYPSTDILITSPECTNHTLAKGARRKPVLAPSLLDEAPLNDELAERSRATMWDVVRFTEFHAYKIVIAENVTDAFWWGPRVPGFKMGNGELFNAWLNAMDALGYRHRVVLLNSMFAPPTPQSRDRMYVVFWRKGQRDPNLDFDVTAWCPRCERVVQARQSWKTHLLKKSAGRPWGSYGRQYVYACPDCQAQAWPGAYPAGTAIDWTLVGQRIGDRKRALARDTRGRISGYLQRYGVQGGTFRLLHDGGARPLTIPLITQTGRQDIGLLMPVAANRSERTTGARTRTTDQPMTTRTETSDLALVVPLRRHAAALDTAGESLPTVCASGNHHGLVERRTAAVLSNMAGNAPRDAETEPSHVVTTGGKLAVVEPGAGAFVMRNNTARGDSGQMSTPIVEPLRTLTGAGHQSLVVPYHRTGEAQPVEEPIGTLTTRDRFALVDLEEVIDDCTFRMLQPHEIARAMVMHEHVDGSPYIVLGNKRDRVAQYGNAVTPPVMRMLVERCAASLEPGGVA